MIKKITCIECPKGCAISVDIENCRVVEMSDGDCPKGKAYAVSEIENPVRTLTSAVLTYGLSLKMCPVRTDKPIPKGRITEAMDEIKKIRIDRPFRAGAVIAKNFLNLDVNLISTRDVSL